MQPPTRERTHSRASSSELVRRGSLLEPSSPGGIRGERQHSRTNSLPPKPEQWSPLERRSASFFSNSTTEASSRVAEVGVATKEGVKRGHPGWMNQDSTLVVELPGDRMMACVFDGHGHEGAVVSGRLRELFTEVGRDLFSSGATSSAFRQLFRRAQATLKKEGHCRHSGSTAVCAVFDFNAKTVMFGSVGDSTGLLVRTGEIVHMTSDHKFDSAEETRIHACGGEIRTVSGVTRIFAPGQNHPGLAMSRAFGDLEAQDLGVSAEPDVSAALPFDSGSCVVLASDGVWDVLPPAVAATQTTTQETPQHMAQSLVTKARARWPAMLRDIDDISAVVVKA